MAGILLVIKYWQFFLLVAAIAAVGGIAYWKHQKQEAGVARSRQAILDRQLATADTMTGTQFEELIVRLLQREGYEAVNRSGGAGDLGADVTARTPNGEKLVVQCKRYTPKKKIGSPDLQRFVGTARPIHHADVALYVTTSHFTTHAESVARKCNIALIDRAKLATWMAEETSLSSHLRR